MKARKIKGGFFFGVFFFGVNKKERFVFCLVQTDHRHLIANTVIHKGRTQANSVVPTLRKLYPEQNTQSFIA